MAFPTSLGLSAPLLGQNIPNYGPYALLANFLLAYGIFSSRVLKKVHGLDHNASPREDLAKYGDAAVRSGKISQSTLNMLKRNESAHANAVENYALLVGAVSMATFAGVENTTINRAVVVYTAARVAYGVVYIFVEREALSYLRGFMWWVANFSCFTLLWKAGGLLSGSV